MLIANKSGVSFRYKREALYEVMDFDMLVEQERLALAAAYEEQKKSTNPKWGVGAAAVASNSLAGGQAGPIKFQVLDSVLRISKDKSERANTVSGQENRLSPSILARRLVSHNSGHRG